MWSVECEDGFCDRAEFLIMAVGALDESKVPDFPGARDFEGQSCHSSKWDSDMDLTGRVGIVGTGASTIQILPSIKDMSEHIYVFQRTGSFVTKKINFKVPKIVLDMVVKFPFLYTITYWLVYCIQESYWLIFKYSAAGKLAKLFFTREMHNAIIQEKHHLRDKIIPTYDPGCKRILLSSDYVSSFNQDNISLVTSPIKSLNQKGIVCEDGTYEIDSIIYATGFNTEDLIYDISITNHNNIEIHDYWAQHGSRSYLGIHTHGYPNLYFLMGPQTVLGHNSVILMMECQMNYINDNICYTIQKGYKYLQVKQSVEEAYYQQAKTDLSESVWSRCTSWYQNKYGDINNWPYSTITYYIKTTLQRDTRRYEAI
eukprot:TRINITY_DN1358_c0_g1_i5.p1 TRINITY_DN1358_c0_g1~~TRINITY_DN1358_c0_g1_i5.p1  ORF type:complete len:370 (-),score=44.16 TRINITY_DN1358_c0_g1_i5:30-1139(-)